MSNKVLSAQSWQINPPSRKRTFLIVDATRRDPPTISTSSCSRLSHIFCCCYNSCNFHNCTKLFFGNEQTKETNTLRSLLYIQLCLRTRHLCRFNNWVSCLWSTHGAWGSRVTRLIRTPIKSVRLETSLGASNEKRLTSTPTLSPVTTYSRDFLTYYLFNFFLWNPLVYPVQSEFYKDRLLAF